MEQLLQDGFTRLGLSLRPGAAEDFRRFYAYLTERNKVMNLTAITGEEEAVRFHFLDCAALLKAWDFKGKTVIDVGTGAGFPGMPLRIAQPDMDLTLLDSLGKRVDFLSQSCALLGYADVTCIHSRAEEAPAAYREHFDIAVSRAVARLNLLCELCLPLVRPGGVFLAMKGPEPREELEEAAGAIALLGGEPAGIFEYTIPGTEVTHSVVMVKKVKKTPEKYPRRFAKIQKNPL